MSLLNAKLSAAGIISESNIIKYILEEDVANKKDMFLGEKYYNAEKKRESVAQIIMWMHPR